MIIDHTQRQSQKPHENSSTERRVPFSISKLEPCFRWALRGGAESHFGEFGDVSCELQSSENLSVRTHYQF